MTKGVVLFILLGIKRLGKITNGVRFTGLAHSVLGLVLAVAAV